MNMFKFGDKVVVNMKKINGSIEPVIGIVSYTFKDGKEPKYLVAMNDGVAYSVSTEDLSLYECKPLDMQILKDLHGREFMRRGICPNCEDERRVINTSVYCPSCGQKLDWKMEDE